MIPSLPDHPPALDRDALIEAIYGLQATMAMYVELLTRPRKTLYQVRIGEDAEHLAWMAEMRQRTQQRTLRAQA